MKDDFGSICVEIESIVKEIGEPLEGNCVYEHQTLNPMDCLLNKRLNYEHLSKKSNSICEIGFNAGHSLLSMILSNPNAKYVSFDLGIHLYSKPCFNLLKNKFRDTQLDIFWGDSRVTIPDFITKNSNTKFDLIHIDGSHKSEIYKEDWKNSLKLSHPGTIIIFDDSDNPKISLFIDEQILGGEVTELKEVLETFGYKHRILIKV
jgi:hypothetical protein